MARLIKTFPSFSLDYVMDELPMDQGWSFYAWSRGNDGWEQFNGLKRSVPGYVAQEVERLMELWKNARS